MSEGATTTESAAGAKQEQAGAGATSTTTSDAGMAALTKRLEASEAANAELQDAVKKTNDENRDKRHAHRETLEKQEQWKEAHGVVTQERDDLAGLLSTAQGDATDAKAWREHTATAKETVDARIEKGDLPASIAALIKVAPPLDALNAIRAHDAESGEQSPTPPNVKPPDAGAGADNKDFNYATATREEKDAWTKKALAAGGASGTQWD